MKAHRETLGHWLLQRMTTTFLVPTILITNVSTLILLNILLLWHIHVGIEEIGDCLRKNVKYILHLVLLSQKSHHMNILSCFHVWSLFPFTIH